MMAGKEQTGILDELDDIIEQGRLQLFNFDYPIYAEEHRQALETMIISHYYMHEIGLETPALFRLELRNTMREIMPYYNQRYASEAIEFNPLHNADLTQQIDGTTKDGGSSTNKVEVAENTKADVTSKERTVGMDTPQGRVPDIDLANLSGYINTASVGDYVGENIGENSSTNEGEAGFSNEGEAHGMTVTTGKTGGESFSRYLDQYRETFINVDLEIIEALRPLFMGVSKWMN